MSTMTMAITARALTTGLTLLTVLTCVAPPIPQEVNEHDDDGDHCKGSNHWTNPTYSVDLRCAADTTGSK